MRPWNFLLALVVILTLVVPAGIVQAEGPKVVTCSSMSCNILTTQFDEIRVALPTDGPVENYYLLFGDDQNVWKGIYSQNRLKGNVLGEGADFGAFQDFPTTVVMRPGSQVVEMGIKYDGKEVCRLRPGVWNAGQDNTTYLPANEKAVCSSAAEISRIERDYAFGFLSQATAVSEGEINLIWGWQAKVTAECDLVINIIDVDIWRLVPAGIPDLVHLGTGERGGADASTLRLLVGETWNISDVRWEYHPALGQISGTKWRLLTPDFTQATLTLGGDRIVISSGFEVATSGANGAKDYRRDWLPSSWVGRPLTVTSLYKEQVGATWLVEFASN